MRSETLEGSRFGVCAVTRLISSAICAAETCGSGRLPGITQRDFCTWVVFPGKLTFAKL